MDKINKNIIRLSKSTIGKFEKKRVLKVLENEFLGMGKEVKNFESLLSSYFNRTALCVVNGTSALQLALQSIGIKSNDEVLIQSITYISSFQAVSALGANPIACDINIKDFTIDLQDAERKITKKTKAIMPVHYGGDTGNLKKIYSFAKKFKLRVIEDASHAFGSYYNNKLVGSFGDIVCFSFDGIKNITSGEGGCIVSNNKKILKFISDARLLGVSKESEKRYSGDRNWIFDVKNQGWRFHMSNIMAAIGISQFKKINKISKYRQKLAKRYDKNLKFFKYINVFHRDYNSIVPHIYPIIIPKLKNREKLRNLLLDKKIQTGIHYYPNHYLSYYRKKNNFVLKNTEFIFPKILTLPLHLDLSISDVDYISKSIKETISKEVND